mmetsp:Transcript_11647/g.19375  ORF Transcript_11647/g.19375 Transcript_11647/m.19375 type:complete len:468 (+) Transcript_11647:138-1541(+)|eukprot:CAMPEP_0119007696 /NCGR_PEP_ID=MMETSP1176-20130426/3180_1 /TAXON_ID=265551 /ORGANISM="Synedropsis recta cf, Strain CCMP1620" /LENGTH=467 /DNA_ID=CAMNT_0006959895 /DNA_START=137 /DNA_END=1540 /DNA_ORIENTATION=-
MEENPRELKKQKLLNIVATRSTVPSPSDDGGGPFVSNADSNSTEGNFLVARAPRDLYREPAAGGVVASVPFSCATYQEGRSVNNEETCVVTADNRHYQVDEAISYRETAEAKQLEEDRKKQRLKIVEAQWEMVRLEREQAKLPMLVRMSRIPAVAHATTSQQPGVPSVVVTTNKASTIVVNPGYSTVIVATEADQGIASASSISTTIPTWYSSTATFIPRYTSGGDATKVEVLTYTAPICFSVGNDNCFGTVPPASMLDHDDEECPICMCHLSSSSTTIEESNAAVTAAAVVVTLVKCGHVYHKECIQEALKRSPRCPKCRANIIEPQGLGPSGKMRITQVCHQFCTGFEAFGCYNIDYRIPNGVQKEYHDNPGIAFRGTNRRAYLPDNKEGSDLLKRLKYAWMHGLTFSVGTSLTTGIANGVIWSSIHHKTSRHGGVHGFPDPNVFDNCNESLDALGVPRAIDLAQ